MTVEERDKIIEVARAVYSAQGCEFPENDREMIEYLYDSVHPQEINCLRLALIAHKVYTDEEMNEDDFYEWHGL